MFLAQAGAARIPAFYGAPDLWCPTCGQPVRAKCGQIVSWHWAHISLRDCDDWAEPDSEWHRGWQDVVPPERREVVIGRHRADVLTPDGLVVELQHSPISVTEIREREGFYGPRMAWLFDARDAYAADRLNLRAKPGSPGIRTFRWKHPRKSVAACRRTVFLDLGDDLVLRLGRIYTGPPCGGWGQLYPSRDFLAAIGGTS